MDKRRDEKAQVGRLKSTKVTGIINKQNATLVVIKVAGLEINKNAREFKKSRYKSKRKLNKGSSKNNEGKNTKKETQYNGERFRIHSQKTQINQQRRRTHQLNRVKEEGRQATGEIYQDDKTISMPENKQRQQNKTTNRTRNVICLYKYILIIQLYIYFLTKIGKNIKNSNRHKNLIW